MTKSKEFVDFYELLEVSPKASRETIERVFRYLAKRCHPDSSDQADVRHFTLLVEACETLTNPETRIAYDIEYEKQQQQVRELVQETSHLNQDSADRHRLLSLFYAQRRRDRRQPGIGNSTVEHIMGLPEDILEFHLWYFREKGWIEREESGLLAITAAGVDQIEAAVQAEETSQRKRLGFENMKSNAMTMPMAPVF